MTESPTDPRTQTRRLAPALVASLLLLVQPQPASAGAQARGELGRYYIKLAYAGTEADEGFDSGGRSAPIASEAFLDTLTAGLARDGEYDETAFRLYAEFGLLERLDLLFSLEWKEIEESFTLAALGFEFPVMRKNSGLGDGMVGLKYQFLDVPLPLAADMRLVFPNYDTSVAALNLETVYSGDDKIPLGNGLHDLVFGLTASSGPWLPWAFGDVRVAYVLSDLDHRRFSDRFLWEVKAGGSYRGLGGALFLDGALSLENGSAPDRISQDNLIFDPAARVTVLNDQEWTRVGLQAWYNFHGLSLEVALVQTVDGRNITENRSIEVALSYQR